LSQAKSTISFVSNKPAESKPAESKPVAAAAAPTAASTSSTTAAAAPATDKKEKDDAPADWESAADDIGAGKATSAASTADATAASASSSSSSSSAATPPASASSSSAPSASDASSSSSSSSASSSDLSKGVSDLKLDADDSRELREAALEEEREERARALAASYAAKKSHDDREHVNIVFIGHVDAGKSTISGQVLLLTGQVDERTIQKYEKEAKEKNRESWYLAYVMDTSEEERAKGKTVEVGRAHFATAKKRYTLLDAPGHKNYVPNMIGGAAQADVGVLVISARRGEFETGFDRGGQTREHAMLCKTLGLHRLIILVNKMDDPTVEWSKERYDEIEGKLSPFLKKTGFNLKEVVYIPASGFTGANIRDPVTADVCPWLKNPRSLFQVLDGMPPLPRDAAGPLRLPIQARYKDMGALFVIGKLESGTLVKDTKLLMMPNRVEVQCLGLSVDDQEVDVCKPGENVIVKIKGIEEEDIQEGFVLSYPDRPCRRAAVFEGQVAILDLLEHKPIMTVGYSAILHIHALAVECQIAQLVSEIDKKTGEAMPGKPRCLRNGSFATVRIKVNESIAIEAFKDHQTLGRFTLRDEGKTIAIGKVLRMKDA